MKKTALVLGLLFVVFAFMRVAKVQAQDNQEVLGVTTTKKVMPLPKIIAGQNVTFGEPVNQDLVVTGGNVNIDSSVNGSTYVAGGQIKISGSISENLVVVGGHIEISGEVKKNVIVAGGSITIDESAHVAGYVLIAGGQTEIDGRVDGDTKVVGGQTVFGSTSIFGGNLTVDSGKITSPATMTVLGTKQLTETKSNGKMPWGYWRNVMPTTAQAGALAGAVVFLKIIGLAGKIVLVFILVRVWSKKLAETTKYVLKNFWVTLGWGALKLFLTPFLVIILLVSVIGIPVAVLTVGLYVGAIFLSSYLSSMVLGHYLMMKGWLKNNNVYVQGVVGLLILEVIGWIPVLGGVVKFVALLIGLGLVIRWEKGLLSVAKS